MTQSFKDRIASLFSKVRQFFHGVLYSVFLHSADACGRLELKLYQLATRYRT